MTMAYDSNKQSINTTTNNLFQEFNPSSYYTIYGDSAYNGHDAPSSDKIYLKLEKEDYYVLFGDYNTGMNKTELTKYDRTFTGIKSRYQRDGVDIIVFSSDTDQIFLKQQIRGEGHSGPYRLQGKNIALNSERITLEVRDRYRSEIVLETHTLTRYADYDINYMDGTLTFREPVFSVNPDLNPQFIIVRYESIDSSQGGNITGGRSEKQVSDNTRIGISFVNEDYVGEKSTLYGVDIQQRISENTRLRLESANIYSEEIFMSRNKDAANYVELNHQSSRWNIRTYARTQDDGFGLGQADISENATKKAGIDSNYRATERININTQANYQQLTLSQAERSLIQTEGQYRFTGGHASLGARAVQELPADGQVLDTQQITSGIRKELFDNKIAVKLNHDHNLGDNNIDYPNKTVSGIDYNFSRTTTLFVEHELADSELRSTQSTLIGVKTSPWKGGEIYTGIRQRQDNTNESTTANAALKQKIVLTNALSISFGMEQSKLVSQHTAEPINPNAPYAVGGSEEFTAVSAGMTYAPGGWTWSGRGEARVASSEYRALLQSSLKTAIGSDLTLLTGLRSNYAQQRLIRSHQTDHDLSLGLAYRPINSRWTVFDKLALRIEENRGEFDTEEQRIVNLLSLNYRQRPWQVSMQYGAKTVGHTIGSLSYDNVVELIGSELRRDINPRWDIGVHGRVLRASLQQQQDYNHGFSVGHTFDKYIWLSTGYNFSGFVDKDYSRNNVTRAGPYIQFRMNFDQHSVRQLFQSEPDSDRQ
ncbi:MAG: hypothetical protein OEW58_09220 [Gammaproteobacteria bacterium]|nr:hypothetical protein [Gammaproteobacteria bacterium]